MSVQLSETNPYGVVLKSRRVSGFWLSETQYVQNRHIPSHDHEGGICCIALSGTCSELYRSRTRDIKPLTVDFIPAGHTHSLQFKSAGVRAFSVDIPPQWLERARDYSLDLHDSVHSRTGMATTAVMRLYREFYNLDSASSLAIEGLTLELLAEISRQQPHTTERRIPKWLTVTQEILHAHFTESPQLSSIAETVGVHPVHLAREFRKRFGCTVGDYVRRLRINYAAQELAHSDKPLADIASDAGFADQSHFCRFFKRLTQMTPTEYRRLHTSR